MCILVQHLSISNLTCEIALDSDNSDDDDDDDDGGDGAQTKAQKKPSHRYNTRSQPKTTAEQANNEAQVEFEFNGSVYPTYQKMVDAKRSRNERVLERSAKAIAAKLGTEYNKSGSNKKTNQNKRKRGAKQSSSEPQRRSGRLSKQGKTSFTKFFSGNDDNKSERSDNSDTSASISDSDDDDDISVAPPSKKKKKSAMEALLAGAKCDTVNDELKEDVESLVWQCGYEGCMKTAKGLNDKGVRACVKHGAKKTPRKRCTIEGCKSYIQNNGVCKRHGAKVKTCTIEGCKKKVQSKGLCYRHGAKALLCTVEGCKNNRVKGGLCYRHGAKVLLCTVEGCKKHRVRDGVCISHGAKAPLCTVEGCKNKRQKGGLCKRHGAYK